MPALFDQQFPAGNFALLGLILLLPLLGAFVNGVFGKRLGKDGVRTMALVAVGGSFVLSVVTFFAVSAAKVSATVSATGPGARLTWTAWEWFRVTGPLRKTVAIDVAFSVDALSAVMLLVVTGVGFLIHVYSTAYMAKDRGFHRYFAYLNLFIFSMLVLILGDNLAVLFIGWEGVGLCSYLLIGFWFQDEKKAAAGKKAFITNRIGDFGLLVAMAMLVYYAGTLSWSGLETNAGVLVQDRVIWPLGNLHASALPTWLADLLTPETPWRMHACTMVALMLFLGCIGKSAQIPLFVWLPDAMAGPTPVSALIHAATMVTAGVYLVARCSFIFALSPAAMAVVAATGALTALLAATIAFAQNDLKKVLAYSTVSQLGFMFIGVGVGAFGAGIFHLVTHAFFKGCLFLCAGSVIHAMHERIHDDERSQDMRHMGGLRAYMPVTHATFGISCLAIAGAPFTSGFFSKDEILFKAFTSQVTAASAAMWTAPEWFGKAIYAVGVVAALGTGFYMFRAYFMTFWGEFNGWKVVARPSAAKRARHRHSEKLEGKAPHESPLAMTVPLVVLAGLALVGGFLYAAPLHIAPLEHFLQPVFRTAGKHLVAASDAPAMVVPLLVVGSVVFAVGFFAAYVVYLKQGGAPAAAFVDAFPRLYRLVSDKWRIDELYEVTVIGMIDAMGETAAQFDRWVIDGIIAKLTAAVIAVAGAALSALQTGRVQVYAAAMVLGTAAMGWFVMTPHADAAVDDSQLRVSGKLNLTAAPGHGYRYRWHEGSDEPPAEFGSKAEHSIDIKRCETKTVHLTVENALGQTDETSFTQCRELFPGCCKPEGTSVVDVPDIKVPNVRPGTHDAGVLGELLPGGTPRTPGGGSPKGGQP